MIHQLPLFSFCLFLYNLYTLRGVIPLLISHKLKEASKIIFWNEFCTRINIFIFSLRYGYSCSLIKTSTLLHGIPQNRVRTFYFFWKSPTVPILDYKVVSHFSYIFSEVFMLYLNWPDTLTWEEFGRKKFFFYEISSAIFIDDFD